MLNVYMDFAGQSSDPKLHQAISELRVGDDLKLVGRELQNNKGIVVGRLSKSCVISDRNVASVKISAIVSRFDKQVIDLVWRERLRVKAWETVLCLIQTS